LRLNIIQNVKIIVIEPDPMIREFVVDVLEFSVNRKVRSFENGQDALNFLTSNGDADIIISEADLPGTPGLNFLSIVKEKWPDRICILMSSDSNNEKAAEALGLEACLSKPFGVKDLFAIVQKFVVESDRKKPPNV